MINCGEMFNQYFGYCEKFLETMEEQFNNGELTIEDFEQDKVFSCNKIINLNGELEKMEMLAEGLKDMVDFCLDYNGIKYNKNMSPYFSEIRRVYKGLKDTYKYLCLSCLNFSIYMTLQHRYPHNTWTGSN